MPCLCVSLHYISISCAFLLRKESLGGISWAFFFSNQNPLNEVGSRIYRVLGVIISTVWEGQATGICPDSVTFFSYIYETFRVWIQILSTPVLVTFQSKVDWLDQSLLHNQSVGAFKLKVVWSAWHLVSLGISLPISKQGHWSFHSKPCKTGIPAVINLMVTPEYTAFLCNQVD